MEKEFDVNNLKTFCYQPFGCSPLRPLKKGKPHSLNVDHFSFDPKVIRSDVTCEYIRERCFLTLHTLFCICTHHLHKCINYLDKSNMDLEEVIFCKLGLYALLHHQMICYFLSVLGDKMRVYDPVKHPWRSVMLKIVNRWKFSQKQFITDVLLSLKYASIIQCLQWQDCPADLLQSNFTDFS